MQKLKGLKPMHGLKRKRKDGRWKAQEIAAVIELSAGAVYSYEEGRREPKKETREKLCKFFNCKEEDLW